MRNVTVLGHPKEFFKNPSVSQVGPESGGRGALGADRGTANSEPRQAEREVLGSSRCGPESHRPLKSGPPGRPGGTLPGTEVAGRVRAMPPAGGRTLGCVSCTSASRHVNEGDRMGQRGEGGPAPRPFPGGTRGSGGGPCAPRGLTWGQRTVDGRFGTALGWSPGMWIRRDWGREGSAPAGGARLGPAHTCHQVTQGVPSQATVPKPTVGLPSAFAIRPGRAMQEAGNGSHRPGLTCDLRAWVAHP